MTNLNPLWTPSTAAIALTLILASPACSAEDARLDLPDDVSSSDATVDTGHPDIESDSGDSSNEADSPDADADAFEAWPPPRTGCNGHPALCDKPFFEVVFPASHNAMSNGEEGWIAPNHNLPLRRQLIDGIRVLLLDTYEEAGQVLLCHGFCRLGSRPLLDAMMELRSFLDSNPDEIVTIIFEDHIPASRTEQIIEAAGLSPYLYVHDVDRGWPTLAEMIASNTRLVITAERAGTPPGWLHHVWDIGWDTPYTFRSIEEFNCSANRGSTDHDLFLVNHWVLNPLPNPALATQVNSYDVLMARIDACLAEWNRLPTFLAIDFHDVGDLFEVVDVLNGILPRR
jgi:hypothetical protein